MLAKKLGLAYLDTGATYRAATLKALRSQVNLDDESALVEMARGLDIQMHPADGGMQVMLDSQDVSREIRSVAVSEKSYYIARSGPIRAVLVDLQRRLGRQLGNFVTEGRDQGSVVFPDADFKFYLDASPEVRARRRYDEMKADGEKVELAQVLQAIVTRDGRDRSRAVAPLVKPEGAIEIDTSDKTIEQVIAEMLSHMEARQ